MYMYVREIVRTPGTGILKLERHVLFHNNFAHIHNPSGGVLFLAGNTDLLLSLLVKVPTSG
jgi:hypothetical protein